MIPVLPGRAQDTVLVATAVGAGAAGGVFFAFSSFVMRALGKLPSNDGLRAMQAINVAAPAPAFMALLFGTALGAVVVGTSALTRRGEVAATYELAGSALYLASILVTVAYHVPRNDALAEVEPGSSRSADAWADYLTGWTRWNHGRTGLALAAAGALTVAVRLRSQA